MTVSQKDEETPTAYPLDASGYDLTGLHAYSATPQGTFTFSVSGRMIGTNTTTNEEFRYDAQGRLLEHWIIGTTVHDELNGLRTRSTGRGSSAWPW